MDTTNALTVGGFVIYPEALSPEDQRALVEDLRAVAAAAPFYTPVMPRTGTPFSVRMTNCGPLGWVSDKDGYRYQATHPVTAEPWPQMPARLCAVWERLADWPAPPEAGLVNLYGPKAKMGLHIDADEDEPHAPVVSISLGDTALYRMGGAARRDPTRSLKLASGAVVVMGGAARQFYHGVDRIYPGTSGLLRDGGRLNVTLRRVTRSAR